MKGYIICNGYLASKKFDENNDLYIEAGKKAGLTLEVITNIEIKYGIENGNAYIKGLKKCDFVLFLDKDIELAKCLEKMGISVFNNSKVIETCDNKAKTFMALSNNNIAMPKTYISPLVFNNTYKGDTYIDYLEENLDYPIIVKECYGSFGVQVYLAQNRNELQCLRDNLIYVPHIYQEFIKTSFGTDIRIHVVGNKYVVAMKRTSDLNFKANISSGGRMEKIDPPAEAIDMAIKISNILKSDFIGVDILFGEDNFVLCEVNSNAHIKNILDCTGVNVAEEIIAHIIKIMYKKTSN
ncbi:MAG: hypothetical protein ATN32_07290 [Candidatus Epulonipiscium fishelsonii]|nr:MAG: hypothetical protein ATN32_07290 [Epulopiscium sp. AS2M-Bin002]